jgi:aspartate aminotransferase-like enzyme
LTNTDGNFLSKTSNQYTEVSEIMVTNENHYDFSHLEKKLANAKDRPFVTCCHSETSNGKLIPIAVVSKLVHKYGGVLFSDCAGSFGGIDIPANTSDIMITGSSKCFGAPSGLSFIFLSDEGKSLFNNSEKSPFSIASSIEKADGGIIEMHPSIPMVYSAQAATKHIFVEGCENVYRRHLLASIDFRKRVENLGYKCLIPSGICSPAVTTISSTTKFDQNWFWKRGLNNIVVGKDGYTRIAHMGACATKEVNNFTISVLAELNHMKAEI